MVKNAEKIWVNQEKNAPNSKNALQKIEKMCKIAGKKMRNTPLHIHTNAAHNEHQRIPALSDTAGRTGGSMLTVKSSNREATTRSPTTAANVTSRCVYVSYCVFCCFFWRPGLRPRNLGHNAALC